ncbi:hypothetical protein HanRHA438_Chr01g0025821 [Helianthus annuus]|uniref:Uncharacterized protein n=1 Tax=Helianthus annuus TaxID=4232 RepID=A0A9K3JW07_HELAN|nr:hypothetical protein HanXRQr2_Chr01g0025401 [Helianthus annuus]KAJ0611836.1 hypothetical protein HanHA300_Chr01g0020281 [Helianthus annuus]KAJ0627192.1 hypothetical protein HanHA89_Chr01g0022491 [Helianthus annuus]KAJ0948320.1 hypothetical protein HanRHA438_Chr01g0025821 [Helianthus annuus]KAJ0957206.1 hypothetical protein HanPSC8_Chr01g0024501 [Helianthus annuus]
MIMQAEIPRRFLSLLYESEQIQKNTRIILLVNTHTCMTNLTETTVPSKQLS